MTRPDALRAALERLYAAARSHVWCLWPDDTGAREVELQAVDKDYKQVESALAHAAPPEPQKADDRVKCSICGLIYRDGETPECQGDKHNRGLLTPEALRYARCTDPRAQKGHSR